jgi:Exodeoxyribonuclease V, gamma subunit
VTTTLRLHTSNRLETLTESLAETLRRPLRSPLQPELVMVQSQGMARWLKLQSAARHGICANYSFPFPKLFCAEVLAANADGRARHSVRAVNVEDRSDLGGSCALGGAHGVTRPTGLPMVGRVTPCAPIVLSLRPDPPFTGEFANRGLALTSEGVSRIHGGGRANLH